MFKPVNATVARARAVGTIQNDDGLNGVLDHFAWGPFASPQITNQPFAVAIVAKDYAEATVTTFNGTVSLSGRVGEADVTVGGGTVPRPYPFGTGYHDARTQVIYPANELGGARRILGLALDMALPPGQVLNRWTIRMKHTSLGNYTDSGWESDGWLAVYQGNETVTQDHGWVSFIFQTPFDYNGVNNLMIDFSFNNSYFTSDGLCLVTDVLQSRSLTFQADSQFGDPLAWSGTTAPAPEVVSYVPHLRLLAGFSLPVAPAVAGRFSNGLWVGPVMVPTPVADLRLRADDGAGHAGLSGLFSVLVIPDTDGDGLPDEWERFYFGSLNAPHGGPGDDPDGDGLTNLEEYLAGTNPLDLESVLRVTSAQWAAGGSIRLGFRSALGKKYRVEKTDTLATPEWRVLQDQISGTGGVVEVIDPAAAQRQSRFYRVRLLP